MAKPRINLRFDAELLAGMRKAVKSKRARDLTDAMEAAAAAWLGVDREVPSSADAPAGSRAEDPGRSSAKRKPRTAAPKAKANGGRVADSRAVKGAVRPIPKSAGKAKR